MNLPIAGLSNLTSPVGQMKGVGLICGLDWAQRPVPRGGSGTQGGLVLLPHAARALLPTDKCEACGPGLGHLLHMTGTLAWSVCCMWRPCQTGPVLVCGPDLDQL